MNQSTLGVTIRQETKDDQPEVYAINTQAFGQEGEAMLVDRLRKTPSFVPELSLVATSGDRLVGHILFSIISISDGNGNKVESLALAPMAVKPEFQQQLAEARAELLQQAMENPESLALTAAAAKSTGKPDAAGLLADLVEAIAAGKGIAQSKGATQ